MCFPLKLVLVVADSDSFVTLRNDVSAIELDSVAVPNQVLVEHVNFTPNTIDLGSMIVCGLLALPHDPVPEMVARWRLLRVPR